MQFTRGVLLIMAGIVFSVLSIRQEVFVPMGVIGLGMILLGGLVSTNSVKESNGR